MTCPLTGRWVGAGVGRRDGSQVDFHFHQRAQDSLHLSRQRAGLPRHLLGSGLYFSFGPMLGMNPNMILSIHWCWGDEHTVIYLHATDTIPFENQPPIHHSHIWSCNKYLWTLPSHQPCPGFWTHMVNKTMMVSALAAEPDKDVKINKYIIQMVRHDGKRRAQMQWQRRKCYAQSLQSCPTLWDPMDCGTLGSSVCGDSLGKDTGVGCHALLQGIFPTQESNPYLRCLLHCRQFLYPLSHLGSPLAHWDPLNLVPASSWYQNVAKQTYRSLSWLPS